MVKNSVIHLIGGQGIPDEVTNVQYVQYTENSHKSKTSMLLAYRMAKWGKRPFSVIGADNTRGGVP